MTLMMLMTLHLECSRLTLNTCFPLVDIYNFCSLKQPLCGFKEKGHQLKGTLKDQEQNECRHCHSSGDTLDWGRKAKINVSPDSYDILHVFKTLKESGIKWSSWWNGMYWSVWLQWIISSEKYVHAHFHRGWQKTGKELHFTVQQQSSEDQYQQNQWAQGVLACFKYGWCWK